MLSRLFFSGRRSLLLRASAILVGVCCTLSGAVAFAAANDLSASAYFIYDTSYYHGEIFEDENIENGHLSELRRLKFSAKYRFSDSISAKVSAEYEVDEAAFAIDDAYLSIDLGSIFEFKVGHYKEPFGLEAQQSLKYQYQRERSVATNSLSFSREKGLGVVAEGESWRWEAAAMLLEAKDKGYDDGFAYTSRFTIAPVNKKKRFIHFGMGLSTRDGVEKKYDIDEPVIAQGLGNLIHSANTKATTINAANLEFAAKYKALVLQSEVFFQDIEDINRVSHQYGGYYTSLLWTIKGRPRSYSKGEVEFSKPKKQTVEIALRHSMADLESHWDGQIAEVISLSVNYYIKSSLRLSLDFEQADLKTFDPEAWDTRSKGDAVSARLQLML